MKDLNGLYRRSSFCREDRCVEVALAGHVVLLRSSATGRVVAFSSAEWRAFVAGVKNDEFDLAAEERTH